MSKFRVTVRFVGSDYEEKVSFFGLHVTRQGSAMEIEVEAPDAESAKSITRGALGAGSNLLLEAQKI